MFQGQRPVILLSSTLTYSNYLVVFLSFPPAQFGIFLGTINVFRLLPPHLPQDVSHPTRQLLDPDIVDWVVETPTVAQLAPAPTVTGE